ncbi:unnamed protein product [Ilex paraguariensis]|uniref:Pectinesterase catalytic domain-containing protein n=1 Tax=Ilex paraguariensis TaxID=185542 RepID=A0ABC8RIY0_9AQUA
MLMPGGVKAHQSTKRWRFVLGQTYQRSIAVPILSISSSAIPGLFYKTVIFMHVVPIPAKRTGIVIQKCRIGATSDLKPVQSSFPTYLGRPWKEYSRTVVMQSTISDVINPAGWYEWDGNFALDTLFYAEYQNTGTGASTSKRVTWKGYRVLTSASQAQPFSPGNFIAGGSWLSSTGFPFSLGL